MQHSTVPYPEHRYLSNVILAYLVIFDDSEDNNLTWLSAQTLVIYENKSLSRSGVERGGSGKKRKG